MYRILLVLLISICANSASAEKLKILVSISPIYSLVKNITQDSAQTELLIHPSYSPHNYQLKPSDIRKIRDADVIVIIDDEFEIFLSKYLNKGKLKAKIIKLIELPSLITLQARDIKVLHLDYESEDHHSHHDHTHDVHNHNHHNKHSYNVDLHIWSNPLNAQIIVQELASIFSKFDGPNSDVYYRNAKSTIHRLRTLDEKISKILDKNVRNKPFIVFHDAYQYLEKRYFLRNAGAVAGNNFIYGPKTMKQLKENIKEYNISCIFAEPQFSDYFVKKVAKNTGTNINYLDIEGGTFGRDVPPEDIYFFMMEKNATNIHQCLTEN